MPDQIQTHLLEQVKQRIDSRLSFVDELAELLDLSKDSVYRRIRGETELTLRESLLICEEYGISLHELSGNASSLFTFQGRFVGNNNLSVYEWLQSILENLLLLDKFPGNKELIYYTKDLPVFYYFNFPRLSAFKMFFWMRTVHRYDEYKSRPFSFNQVPQDMIALGERIWQKYCKIPSLEIWSTETTIITLKQIEYYYDCGYFENPEDALLILEEFELLMKETKVWMSNGQKPAGESMVIYRNDVLFGDNTILFKYGNDRTLFTPFGGLSLISTSNPVFTEYVESFLDTVIQRAVLISQTGEKERNRFFNQNSININSLKKRLTG